MLQTIDLRNRELRHLDEVVPRAQLDISKAVDQVKPIMDDVRTRGEEAIADYCERFDGVRPTSFRVPLAKRDEALKALDPAVRAALELSIEHNTIGHRQQLPQEKTVEVVPGGRITQRWIPVSRVGLYVPGGLAVYPSSVVMNVVAARVAGVKSIAVVSPPQKEFGGSVHPTILAACALLDVTEIYAVGGAQAIAMLAYGVDGPNLQVEPVDVITGPGNIFVAAAKRVATAVCGIDAEAGTTEIAIIADDSANPHYVAADLLSQAEHDPAAASVLITDSWDFAQQVDAALGEQVAATKHRQRVEQALGGPQSGMIIVNNIDDAITVANAYGAEHLEIQTRDSQAVAGRIHNAGAIFVGSYTPVPLGDYLAGSNHVLPTGGTARYAAGLSVMAYIKPVQVINYSDDALASMADPLQALAYSEDLPAHFDAVHIRQTHR